MRELNEAYEVLADEQNRAQYDRGRKRRSTEDYDGESDATRSTFKEAEQTDMTDWDVANEYYPDLESLYSNLKQTSFRLAFAFRTTILETKQYAGRHKIAADMKLKFLQLYFGSNPAILTFAQKLIEQGHSAAAKELNKAITVLGSSIDAQIVIGKIISKFRVFDPEIQRLANSLIKHHYGYYDDAVALIEKLGGSVRNTKQPGFFGKLVTSIDVLGLHHECETYAEVVDWVRKNVVPKVVSR
jgi:curved DNA-binding protein CbpA